MQTCQSAVPSRARAAPRCPAAGPIYPLLGSVEPFGARISPQDTDTAPSLCPGWGGIAPIWVPVWALGAGEHPRGGDLGGCCGSAAWWCGGSLLPARRAGAGTKVGAPLPAGRADRAVHPQLSPTGCYCTGETEAGLRWGAARTVTANEPSTASPATSPPEAFCCRGGRRGAAPPNFPRSQKATALRRPCGQHPAHAALPARRAKPGRRNPAELLVAARSLHPRRSPGLEGVPSSPPGPPQLLDG